MIWSWGRLPGRELAHALERPDSTVSACGVWLLGGVVWVPVSRVEALAVCGSCVALVGES